MNEQKLTVTPAEAAKMIGVSRPVVYDLCHSGDLPCIQIGRRILIPIDRLRMWLNETNVVNR